MKQAIAVCIRCGMDVPVPFVYGGTECAACSAGHPLLHAIPANATYEEAMCQGAALATAIRTELRFLFCAERAPAFPPLARAHALLACALRGVLITDGTIIDRRAQRISPYAALFTTARVERRWPDAQWDAFFRFADIDLGMLLAARLEVLDTILTDNGLIGIMRAGYGPEWGEYLVARTNGLTLTPLEWQMKQRVRAGHTPQQNGLLRAIAEQTIILIREMGGRP